MHELHTEFYVPEQYSDQAKLYLNILCWFIPILLSLSIFTLVVYSSILSFCSEMLWSSPFASSESPASWITLSPIVSSISDQWQCVDQWQCEWILQCPVYSDLDPIL